LTHNPTVPQLCYSTWGSGFYSEHWFTEVNCWMYGVLKLVEANIDLDNDHSAITAFEKLCASDHMFVYDDPNQQALVRKIFIQQYRDVAQEITFAKREIAATFPVDPFKSFFVYATLDETVDDVKFTISKLSQATGARGRNSIIQAKHVKHANVNIYYQYFPMQPSKDYLLEVSNSTAMRTFSTPAFGVPINIGKELSIKPRYDLDKMMANLEKIWGQEEDIPLLADATINSTPIHKKSELNKLLGGKRVAIYKYNKEFYSLARFQDLSPFEIDCVFDDSVNLDDSSKYMQGDATDIPVINNIDKIDERPFDALVFTSALNFETEIPFCKKLLEIAVTRKIPVISLYDDVLHYDIFGSFKPCTQDFYIIGLNQADTVPEADTRLTARKHTNDETSARNVLAVFGTDSVQGKFTTQLYLREALKHHINVAHWATEPTGSLLGADKGYSRTYGALSEAQRLTFERSALNTLASESDLVITGGQNSIIFAPPGKQKNTNASTDIFARFLPRFVVLTVSVDTAPDNVQESLDYVAQLANTHNINTRVIALAMMTGRKIRGSRWTDTYFLSVDTKAVAQAKQSFQDAFDMPVFVVPDEINEFASAVSKVNFLDA